MSKAIPIMATVVAFVALTLISGVVYADEKNGKPFEVIWDAIYKLESAPDNGITGVYPVHEMGSIPGDTSLPVTATCNSGDKVLGGGYDQLPLGVTVIADKPDGDNGWIVIFDSISSSKSKPVTVHVICATP